MAICLQLPAVVFLILSTIIQPLLCQDSCESVLRPQLSYLSVDDIANNWALYCQAKVTDNKDGVQLVPGVPPSGAMHWDKLGTMATKTALQPTDANFELKVRITANRTNARPEGFAIYLTLNSTLDTTTCASGNRNAGNVSFGISNPPVNALAIRVYGYNKFLSVSKFPTTPDSTIQWPGLSQPNKYTLGYTTNFTVEDFDDMTILARFLNGKLTVEMTTVSQNTIRKVDNFLTDVSVPDLKAIFTSGQGVFAISAGVWKPVYFHDPIVRSVEFSTSRVTATTGSEVDMIGKLAAWTRAASSAAKTAQSIVPSFPVRHDYFETTDEVMKNCNHIDSNRYAPPSPVAGKSIEIGIAFEIRSLSGISNVDQTISVTAVLLFHWQVDTCPWLSSTVISRQPYEQMYVASPEKVWRPTFRYVSAADSNVYMVHDKVGDSFLAAMDTNPVKANRSYYFYWTREGAFTSSCVLQLERFPFDQQTCTFEFALERDSKLISFTDKSLHLFCEKSVADNTEWKIVTTQKTIGAQKLQGINGSTACFAVTLQRLSSYYVQNLFIPSGVLGMLQLGAFMIPPSESSRAGFTMTIMLSLTVAQAGVLEHVPKKPSTNLLSLYIQRMAWYAAACGIYVLFMLLVSTTTKATVKFCGHRMSLLRLIDGITFLGALAATAVINALFVINLV